MAALGPINQIDNPGSIFNIGLRLLRKINRQFIWILSTAIVLSTVSGGYVAAQNTGCVDGNCPDVPSDGISYTSIISTVNVGNNVPDVTNVNDGVIGIELTQSGVNGAAGIEVEYQTLPYDTDNNNSTPLVSVLVDDQNNPVIVNGDQYIFENGPDSFTIDGTLYTELELAQFLAVNSIDDGASITGSLTVNNEGPFTTSNAGGILAKSTGGRGGNGGVVNLLFVEFGLNGDRGGNAGSVVVDNNALISVSSNVEEHHGISAISQGGNGGDGGGFFALVYSDPGGGGNGGNGSDVSVILGTESDITTDGLKSHGVLAKSQGGDGGSGGRATAAFAIGSDGGNGGDAGNVIVNNAGKIMTLGNNSHGIYAKSVGAGAGSGSSSGGIYSEGGNGGGESYGAMVTVNNRGSITTEQSDSFGILAQSIGGGGGDGGGAGGWFTVGGRGGSGGGSDNATINDSGTVKTSGDRSTAIFAQSIGGGGGNGGDAVSVSPTISVAVGGAGGLGGDGDNATVNTDESDIDTSGNEAHGIHVQSIGGGGGNGGLAVSGTLGSSPVDVSIAIGGNGGGGGNAGDIVSVNTSNDTTIDTTGIRSYGIAAQSIGGGGGNGGTALSNSGGTGFKVSVSIGGTGAMAGDGKTVDIDNGANIKTIGDFSAGIFTQSIGGGGGNGGFAGSLAVGGASASVSLGGDGNAGGVGGTIDIVNFGTIETDGNGAAGIFAQSIGGGGGNGGSALATSIGLASVTTTVGGKGKEGGNGGLVDILNTGLISTQGHNSAGVFAQSIGGGGGNGGDATSLSLAGPVAVAVGVGGDGGEGGNGGNVIVKNEGIIETEGVTSDGVFAQSIGGSGGSGGSATTGTLVFPIEIEGVEIPAISANVAVGGNGAGGGTAGTAEVTNSGQITTTNFMSSGLFAQSVGGSGGRGGHATNISLAFDATFKGKVSVGGSGGKGGVGNNVTVNNLGQIYTQNDFSNGVFAQSIGGGGGSGGNSTNVSLSLTPPPTAPEDFIPTPSVDFDLAIGGDGGMGANAGEVTVINEGTIITEGNFASGVMAQSVGGSGGFGGDARVISVELTADPMDFMPLTDLTSFDMSFVFGGSGNGGGNGGNVTVENTTDRDTFSIHTNGAFSHGIVAQSVGGGGGMGGSAMTFEFSNADIMPDIPVLDDISGLTSIEMTLQGSGGAGGNGGNILLNSEGNIWTGGDFAMGVVGQSVGGGGGLAGFFNPHGITSNEIVNDLFNAVIDTDAGLSFSGSVGGTGSAGTVTVNHIGNIETIGDGAHGLFAQSAAAQGAADNVNITMTGSIYTIGEQSSGIFAQSSGNAVNGNITINLNSFEGVVQGGSGSGAGVNILGGVTNTLNNSGMITSLSSENGNAVLGTSGAETINNFGVIIGSVDLGSGTNVFYNKEKARLNSGATLYLGGGNTFNNEGTLSLGADGNIFTTVLTGNLVQSGSGIFAVDIDTSIGMADYLNISGTADLAGMVDLNILNPGHVVPGTHQNIIVKAANNVTDSGLSLNYQSSIVIDYSLLYPNPTDVVLSTSIDFSPSQGLSHNQGTVGEAINTILLAGGSDSLAPFVTELLEISGLAELAAAYDDLSPATYDILSSTTIDLTSQYTQTLIKRMHSLRSFIECLDSNMNYSQNKEYGYWTEGFGQWANQDTHRGSTGYEADTKGMAFGIDRLFNDRVLAGISIGMSNADIRLKQNQGNGDIKSYFGSVYGSYFTDRMYVDGVLSFGQQDYDNMRSTNIGSISNIISSSHDGESYAAYIESGYLLKAWAWALQPFMAFGYTYLDDEGYDEHGAEGINLSIDGRRTDSLISDLGARMAFPFKTKTWLCIPEATLAWHHDFDIDSRNIVAAFDSAPNIKFKSVGEGYDKDGLILGTTLTLINKNDISISINYTGDIRASYNSYSFTGGIRYEF